MKTYGCPPELFERAKALLSAQGRVISSVFPVSYTNDFSEQDTFYLGDLVCKRPFRPIVTSRVTLTNTTTETILIAAPSSQQVRLLSVTINNTDGTNAAWLELLNGSAGNVMYKKRAGSTAQVSTTHCDVFADGIDFSVNTAVYAKMTGAVTSCEVVVSYYLISDEHIEVTAFDDSVFKVNLNPDSTVHLPNQFIKAVAINDLATTMGVLFNGWLVLAPEIVGDIPS